MQVSIRTVRAVPFGLALLAFFLPFVTISCGGVTLTLSGLELMTGTELRAPGMFGPSSAQTVPSEPLAVLAAVCAIAGLAVAAIGGRAGRLGSSAAGAAGIVLLLALRGKIDREATRQAMGLFQIRYAAGYWLALTGFLAGAALGLVIGVRASSRAGPTAGSS